VKPSSDASHLQDIMSNPTSPQKFPYVMDMAPGTYYWCACGGSKSQPFCDGSHKGTAFAPVKTA
jgi:CDGSH-type Zn-finger protein